MTLEASGKRKCPVRRPVGKAGVLFLVEDGYERVQLSVDGARPELVVLGCRRKQAEPAMRSRQIAFLHGFCLELPP